MYANLVSARRGRGHVFSDWRKSKCARGSRGLFHPLPPPTRWPPRQQASLLPPSIASYLFSTKKVKSNLHTGVEKGVTRTKGSISPFSIPRLYKGLQCTAVSWTKRKLVQLPKWQHVMYYSVTIILMQWNTGVYRFQLFVHPQNCLQKCPIWSLNNWIQIGFCQKPGFLHIPAQAGS